MEDLGDHLQILLPLMVFRMNTLAHVDQGISVGIIFPAFST